MRHVKCKTELNNNKKKKLIDCAFMPYKEEIMSAMFKGRLCRPLKMYTLLCTYHIPL